MSEKNVETVRRVYEGVNARLEVPRELFDPDYEFDNTELWPDIGEVLGFDAAQEAMREYWETFEAYHVEIEEVIYADEGRVVDVVRDGGRMRGTDAEVWNRFFHVWTLRDGRIVRLSIHTDRNRRRVPRYAHLRRPPTPPRGDRARSGRTCRHRPAASGTDTGAPAAPRTGRPDPATAAPRTSRRGRPPYLGHA